MARSLALAAHTQQRYPMHAALNHGGSTAWTAVLAGLIPIIGIAAVGIIVYALVRKE